MKIKPQIRTKIIAILISIFACSFFEQTNAQTLQVYPAAIIFDCETGSYENDALTITNGGAPVDRPEYNLGNNNNPVAYIMNQSNRKIEVMFEYENTFPGKAHLLLTLTKSDGTGAPIGTVCNLFIPNYEFGGEYISIQLQGDLPAVVGKHEFEWEWEIYAIPVNEPGYSAGWNTSNTEHAYYTLLAAPIEPVEEPWANVLDLACSWAANADTEQEVLAVVTVGAYNHFDTIKEYDAGTSSAMYVSFDLTSFFTNNTVNCEDMSAAIQVFTWMLGGTETEVMVINDKNMSQTFEYKKIKPIGKDWEENGTWYFHQVGWLNNVYDACIMLDSVPRVPVNESVNGTYKDDLYFSGAWYPDTVRTFHYEYVFSLVSIKKC
ncbi:MAG: hypothetical protein JXR61_08435 [Prolixibacteraceae bacterium]|nr:hypothetical protein [Prolixibacteraceae bacterium]